MRPGSSPTSSRVVQMSQPSWLPPSTSALRTLPSSVMKPVAQQRQPHFPSYQGYTPQNSALATTNSFFKPKDTASLQFSSTSYQITEKNHLENVDILSDFTASSSTNIPNTLNMACQSSTRQVTTTDSCLKMIEIMITETGGKAFMCKCCPYVSRRRNDTIVHVRRHIGEKPYRCTICDHRSAKKSNMNAHIRGHNIAAPQENALL